MTKTYISSVVRSAQGIIVLGNKLKKLFSSFFKDERIFVVPNGANFNFPLSKRKSLDKVRLLYLGNLQPSKGIEDILNAVAMLKKGDGVSEFYADIIGDWWDDITRDLCFELINKNNLPVTFHKPLTGEEKFLFLTNADIFIFPPREPEGHPWVIVEAMAAGLPIISTDQGAITESVIDGVNGFIVEKQNPHQIAEKIKLLIENPELRIKMGKESRRLYEENFTEEKMVERLTQAFNATINRK
ncbi:MAG: hypothetical protein A2163_08240 [Actinobacteria bacterium RBG_13_35_12]|nr:MAG: hypothetical protein A2163_08240 [Actinobacteria bacterium RBG_13_35_12]